VRPDLLSASSIAFPSRFFWLLALGGAVLQATTSVNNFSRPPVGPESVRAAIPLVIPAFGDTGPAGLGDLPPDGGKLSPAKTAFALGYLVVGLQVLVFNP
jgi:hypothetical protein